LGLLFYLHIAKFQRSFSTENFHHYLKLSLLFIYLFDRTVESIKWSIDNFYSFTNYKRNIYRLIYFGKFIYLTDHSIYFRLTKWNRISTFYFTKKANHTLHSLNCVNHLTNQVGFYHNVTRKIVSFLTYFLAIAYLIYLFGRYKYLTKVVAQTLEFDFIFDVAFHLVFLSGNSSN